MVKIVKVENVVFVPEGCGAIDDHYLVSGIDDQGRSVKKEVFVDGINDESPAVILAIQPYLAKDGGDLLGRLWD